MKLILATFTYNLKSCLLKAFLSERRFTFHKKKVDELLSEIEREMEKDEVMNDECLKETEKWKNAGLDGNIVEIYGGDSIIDCFLKIQYMYGDRCRALVSTSSVYHFGI